MAIKSFMEDKGKSKQPASGAAKKAAESAAGFKKEKGSRSGPAASNPGGGGVPIPHTRWGDTAASVSGQPLNRPGAIGSPFALPQTWTGAGADVGNVGSGQWGEYAGNRGGFQNPGGVDQITGAGFSPTDLGAGVGSYGSGYTGPDTMAQTGALADMGYSTATMPKLYQDPQVLANEVLLAMGIDNPSMAAILGDALYPAMYAYMLGAPNGADLSDNAILNSTSDYMQQMVTPGGQMPDANALMQSIYGMDEDSIGGALLGLLGNDPQQQVGYVNDAMQAARYNLNPLAQRAYRNAMDYYGTQYLTDAIKDPNAMDYTAYLNASPLARWSR